MSKIHCKNWFFSVKVFSTKLHVSTSRGRCPCVRLNTDNLPPLLPTAPSTHNSFTASPCWKGQHVTLQVTAAPWSARRIIAALCETNHIVLDRFSVKECNNKACISLHYCLCCLAQWILWLNKKHEPSVDQFFRLLHSTLSLNRPGYLSPWGCSRWNPILLGWGMNKAHTKTWRAAFIKGLALWAPKDCHLFFLFRKLSSPKEHYGMQTSITSILSIFNLASLSCGYAPCSCCPVCFPFGHYRTLFSSLCCRSLAPSVHPSSML